MCGIFGIWHKDGRPADQQRVIAAADLMTHRGPDAPGLFLRGPLAFAHRRLKIIDLSDAANQPFGDGTDVLVYNGELFNYRLLRKELEQHVTFRTSSDTEVVFHALQQWGKEALMRFNGQFAFAFYKQHENQLLLARDHAGICPLYTYEDGKTLIFASEIKPLLHVTGPQQLSAQGLADYFGYRYGIQNGHTLFSGVRRFPAAHWRIWDMNASTSRSERYWRMEWTPSLPVGEIASTVTSLLNEEIALQSVADVPVGMFLSGGIDSSAVLHGLSPHVQKVIAFTMRFSSADADVEQVARLEKMYPIARHTVPYSMGVVERLSRVVHSLEEPFGDVIICANDALAAAAARHVKVALSGEGGDEAFFGYDHQQAFLSLSKLRASKLLVLCASLGLKNIPPAVLGSLQGYPGKFTACEVAHIRRVVQAIRTPGQAYLALSRLFTSEDLRGLFTRQWVSLGAADTDEQPILDIFSREPDLARASIRAETEQFLLGVNLLKQDRLSMAHSLETRVPLVARRILDIIGRIPTATLLAKPRKRLLREYAGGTSMPKRAFSVLASRENVTMLCSLFDHHASPEKIEAAGILAPTAVASIRGRLERGGMLDVKRAMCVLVFMAWYASFQDNIKN